MLHVIDPGTPAPIHGYLVNDHLRRLSDAAIAGESLAPVMRAIVGELGFDSFTYGMAADSHPMRRDSPAYAWTTLPHAWLRLYGERGYIEVDPRVTGTDNRNVPYVWDAGEFAADARCSDFLRDAARFGVASGVALSFRDPRHGRILVALDSPIARLDEVRSRRIGDRLGEIVLLAMAFHDLFMAHLGCRPSLMTRVTPLSPRESQCLEMAANGLTSEDIAMKLGIKARTANFHFGKIMTKLGVLNRKEAIALGMAHGLIRPNPLAMRPLPSPRLHPRPK
jgi:LuxR family transcriptional activator of bioluminescence operon